MGRTKSRANGTGTAFRSGSTFTARIVADWKVSADGTHRIPIYKSKSGFKTRTAALRYCETLREEYKDRVAVKTLQHVIDEWEKIYAPRIKAQTMKNYRSNLSHFSVLFPRKIDEITPADLQDCMDACPSGKQVHNGMKVVARLVWAYAKDRRYVREDITGNLYTGKGKSVKRSPISESDVARIKDAIGTVRYAEYIYCLCYLGFRPGEFLCLRKSSFHEENGIPYLVGGGKTEAGTDRIVVIPPQIIDIVRDRLFVPGTDLLFPRYVLKRGNNSGRFIRFDEITYHYFGVSIFRPVMAKLGCDTTKVPYCARHTYSDKLKNAEGSDKAKAELMGHTKYDFTQKMYQSSDLNDLLAVAVSLE